MSFGELRIIYGQAYIRNEKKAANVKVSLRSVKRSQGVVVTQKNKKEQEQEQTY